MDFSDAGVENSHPVANLVMSSFHIASLNSRSPRQIARVDSLDRNRLQTKLLATDLQRLGLRVPNSHDLPTLDECVSSSLTGSEQSMEFAPVGFDFLLQGHTQ